MSAAVACVWLVKSEPSAFSWHNLVRSPRRTTAWDGVRNYQARNYLRDGFRLGQLVFFYHSCSKPLAIVGTMRVVREAYPDPKWRPDERGPIHQQSCWVAVDLQAEAAMPTAVTLPMLRAEPACAKLPLLARNSRLSVQPVDAAAAAAILRLGGLDEDLLVQRGD